MVKDGKRYKCPYCGEEWTPRVAHPKECPHCHRRLAVHPPSSSTSPEREGVTVLEKAATTRMYTPSHGGRWPQWTPGPSGPELFFKNRTDEAAHDIGLAIVECSLDTGEDIPLPGKASLRFRKEFMVWLSDEFLFTPSTHGGRMAEWLRERETYTARLNLQAWQLALKWARWELGRMTWEEREAMVQAGPFHARKRREEEAEARRAQHLRRRGEG